MTMKQLADGTTVSRIKSEKPEREIIPVSISEDDKIFSKAMLKEAMEILEQSKDSTALKQLARIALIVLHDQKVGLILKTLFENKRKNKRQGIIDYEV